MDLNYTPEERAFQDEVRGWLNDNLPAHIRERSRKAHSYVPRDDLRQWHRIVYEKGWVAPGWPVEYGGTGWSAAQKFIYDEEYQAAGAPRLSPFGLSMCGPVIYTFGSQEQKERYLPRILSCEDLWCQGYSEPGSGSDLASLSTRAVRDGEEYVVNGHKIWTSHAHHADMMFCLVRTDAEAKPQAGISFLLIDMTTPGITVKPIISIDGNHYLNEVFLDDVRVPMENRVGEENKGWTYAKFLLGHERTGIAGVSKSKEKVRRIKQMASNESDGGERLLDEPGFRQQLSSIEVDLHALEVTNLRMMAEMSAGRPPGPEFSTLKISGTQIEQGLNELAVTLLGYYGAPYGQSQRNPDANEPPVGPDYAMGLVQEHLLRRAASIYGGSNEIQRNVIAKAVLEM